MNQNGPSSRRLANRLHAYIMCGGGGTRLWPLSRADNPKQNLIHDGNDTMLAETVQRIRKLDVPGLDVTVNFMGSILQRRSMGEVRLQQSAENGAVICEPIGRNTAAAVAIASLFAPSVEDDDPLILIAPSDHVIRPDEDFSEAIAKAVLPANEGQIVVFGLVPSWPATGYGYIEAEGSSDVAPVLSFREKPDAQTAQQYMETGRHLWNAGIFLFRASVMIEALKQYAPAILDASVAALDGSGRDHHEVLLNPDLFQKIPAESIDYAVMEHATNVTVVRTRFDWHDVGSFSALKALRKPDEDGNASYGDVLIRDCNDSLFHSEGPLIAAIGLDGISVIATPDVTLVTPLERSQDIRKLVSTLNHDQRLETKRTPWITDNAASRGALVSQWRNWLMQDALSVWADRGI
jgi:mannose-1-phosphate guanylyltransferase/mannose-6-phosphate isomerase